MSVTAVPLPPLQKTGWRSRGSGMTSLAAAPLPPSPTDRPPRVRLEFLDGLRGLAALYVVLYHTCLEVINYGDRRAVSPSVWHLITPLLHGHFAVDLFIVLSGFCLMLPVVRSRDEQLAGGFGGYLRRRARRILPPYYAALALSLLIACVPMMQEPTGTFWDMSLPAFTPSVLASHALLIHNLNPDWLLKINVSLWSVATEWQIYFFLPLLLLPVWRRFGLVPLLLVAFAVGLAPHFLPGGTQFDGAAPWYIGLFAVGMAAAVIRFSPRFAGTRLRNETPWGLLTGVLSVCAAVVVLRLPVVWQKYAFLWDGVVGLTAAGLILTCAQETVGRPGARPSALRRLFEAKGSVTLGTFSYSLYLIHYPLLSLANLALLRLPLSGDVRLFCLLFGGTPLCLGAAYLFYLAFERRFVFGHAPKPRSAPVPAHSLAV